MNSISQQEIDAMGQRLKAAAASTDHIDVDEPEDRRVSTGDAEVVATLRTGDTAFSIIKNRAGKDSFAVVGFDRRSKTGATLAANAETLRQFARAIIRGVK